jgi:hypothetical protein
MPSPSRLMSKYLAPKLGVGGLLVLGVLFAALAFVVANASPIQLLLAVCVFLAVWVWASHAVELRRQHLQALAGSRPGETICEFARSFDCRTTDTWVIRAVYEELQEELRLGSTSFPVRANDSLTDDLRIDPEDLDLSLAPAIAARSGRTLERDDANPYWGKVKTVADLVCFFNQQPIQSRRHPAAATLPR